MFSIRKSEYDFLIADTVGEFEDACIRLKTDEILFNNMIDVCNKRQNDHTNEDIVKQWVKGFSLI
jgi:hypothetical protein